MPRIEVPTEGSVHSKTSGVSSASGMSSAWSVLFGNNQGRVKQTRKLVFDAQYALIKNRSRRFYHIMFLLIFIGEFQLLYYSTTPEVAVWAQPMGQVQFLINKSSFTDALFGNLFFTATTLTDAIVLIMFVTVAVFPPLCYLIMGRAIAANREPPRLVSAVVLWVAPILYTIVQFPLLCVGHTVIYRLISGLSFQTAIVLAVGVPACIINLGSTVFFRTTLIHTDITQPTFFTAINTRILGIVFLGESLHGLVYATVIHRGLSPKIRSLSGFAVIIFNFWLITITQPFIKRSANYLLAGVFSFHTFMGVAIKLIAAIHTEWFLLLPFIATPIPLVILPVINYVITVRMRRFMAILVLYEQQAAQCTTIAPAPPLQAPRYLSGALAARALGTAFRQIHSEAVRGAKAFSDQPVDLPGFPGSPQFMDTHTITVERAAVDAAVQVRVRALFRAFQFLFPRHPHSGDLLTAYLLTVMSYRPVNLNDGLKRAERHMTRSRLLPDKAFLLYVVFKSRMDLLSGDPDQAERAERSRRLHTINKSQRTLYDHRRRFWETVDGCRGRPLTTRAVNDLLGLAEKESKELTHIQNAYRPLLAKATPNVIRDYAVFCKVALGMDDQYKIFLNTAEDLEIAGRQTTSAVQPATVDVADVGGFFIWHSALEFRSMLVMVFLGIMTVTLISCIYVIFRIVFYNLMWIFFAAAALTLGVQNASAGAYYMQYTGGDFTMMAAHSAMTAQLFAAVGNTAPVDYIQASLAEFTQGWLPVTHSPGVNTTAGFLDWVDTVQTPSVEMTWAMGTTATQPILHRMLMFMSDHLMTLDTLHTNVTLGGQTVEYPIGQATAMVIGAVNGLVNDGVTMMRTAPDPDTTLATLDVGSTIVAPKLSLIISSEKGVITGIRETFRQVFVATQNFPEVIVGLCIVLTGIFGVSLFLVTAFTLVRPLMKAYSMQLGIIRIFLMLPAAVTDAMGHMESTRHATVPTTHQTDVQRRLKEVVPEDSDLAASTSDLNTVEIMADSKLPIIAQLRYTGTGSTSNSSFNYSAGTGSGTLQAQTSESESSSTTGSVSDLSGDSDFSGSDDLGTQVTRALNGHVGPSHLYPSGSSSSSFSDAGIMSPASIASPRAVDEVEELERTNSRERESPRTPHDEVVVRDTPPAPTHARPRSMGSTLSFNDTSDSAMLDGTGDETDLIDAATLYSASGQPSRLHSHSQLVTDTSDVLNTATKRRSWISKLLRSRQDAIAAAVEQQCSDIPALARWTRVARTLSRRRLLAVLPRVVVWNVFFFGALIAALGLVSYRILTDIRTGTTGYIAYQGLLAANGIAQDALEILTLESATGLNATDGREAFMGHAGELSRVLGWLTSSSVEANDPWQPDPRTILGAGVNTAARFMLASSWASGPYGGDIQALLYNRECAIKPFIPTECTPEFGGTGTPISTELDSGLLQAISWYLTQADAFRRLPVNGTALDAAKDAIVDSNLKHVQPYMVQLQGLIRNRFSSSVADTGVIIIVLAAILVAVLAIMFFAIYRTAAEQMRRRQQQMLAILDRVVRTHGKSFNPLTMALVHDIRPQHFDDER